MGDRLRTLWSFDDLDATEARFRSALDAEQTPGGRAEILTQLARVEGLRGQFGAGEALLRQAETMGDGTVPRARILLERGRLRRSDGDEVAAAPLFESAFRLALEGDEPFLAADAAHMAALVEPEREGMLAWTNEGIQVASEDDEARYWLGPLLNNLGWAHYEAAEYTQALDAFERALEARERDPSDRGPIEIARYAVGKTLRALGRPEEATALLEEAVEWADASGAPDGWFHEELAEDYAALGRDEAAAEHARIAIGLLSEADPSFTKDADRVSRLKSLAGA